MGAVDVGVGHDHDLVIAQLLEVELLAADAGAERLDQRADFLRAEHPVEARALDVEDLALQRQDRLVLAVAALLGRAAGAVALDQEQFGLGRDRAPGSRRACRASEAMPITDLRLASRALRAASRAAAASMIFWMMVRAWAGFSSSHSAHLVGHQAFERLADLGADQLVLGLRAELGIGQLDRDDRGQPFAHVLAGQADLLALQHARLVGIIVERAGQRGAEGGEVGAAVALRDVVGEGEDVLVIAVVPFERDLDADVVALAAESRSGREPAASWRGRDI